MLNVILPAAGKGERLSLPFPKELYCLDKNKALIDYSFDLFSGYGRSDVNFTVIINEDKTDIIKYLAKYKHDYNISFTFQDPKEKEYTGAIKSAYHLFGEYNLVLLPDTYLKLKEDNNDIRKVVMNALFETGFSFLVKNTDDHDLLKTKGALKLKDGLVIDYEDKPKNNLHEYNGFWCALAFRKRNFHECMAFMEKSTLQQDDRLDIQETCIYNSKVIEVEEYYDLGTWDEIKRITFSDRL